MGALHASGWDFIWTKTAYAAEGGHREGAFIVPSPDDY